MVQLIAGGVFTLVLGLIVWLHWYQKRLYCRGAKKSHRKSNEAVQLWMEQTASKFIYALKHYLNEQGIDCEYVRGAVADSTGKNHGVVVGLIIHGADYRDACIISEQVFLSQPTAVVTISLHNTISLVGQPPQAIINYDPNDPTFLDQLVAQLRVFVATFKS